MRLLYLLPIVTLAACGGTGVMGESYVGRVGSQAWFETAAPQTIAAHYEQQCLAYGYRQGSSDMAGCIQNAASQGLRSAENRAANFQAGIAQASAINQNNAAIAAANRPQMTTCNRFGNTVNCTTY